MKAPPLDASIAALVDRYGMRCTTQALARLALDWAAHLHDRGDVAGETKARMQAALFRDIASRRSFDD